MDKNRGEYFNTEPKFWSWLSSQLRRVWSTHPTKLDFIKSIRFIKKVGNGRPLYHVTCNICQKDFQLKEIEVNHKQKCGNIKEAGHALRMFDVGYDDLEALCKPCHAIVTYSERQGISFQEAVIEKKVIAFGNKTVHDQKAILGAQSVAKNATQRKAEYRELLLKEKP